MLILWGGPHKKVELSTPYQKCKQHLDKLKENTTPWVLDGASSSYHSLIAYSQKLQFVVNPYLWPLKYHFANKSPNLFLQICKQQDLAKLKEVKEEEEEEEEEEKKQQHRYLLAHQMAATQWLHIYCANS